MPTQHTSKGANRLNKPKPPKATKERQPKTMVTVRYSCGHSATFESPAPKRGDYVTCGTCGKAVHVR